VLFRSGSRQARRTDPGSRDQPPTDSSGRRMRAMADRRPTLMLIDGPSIVYRAYFAMMQTPLTTSDGMLVTGSEGRRGGKEVKYGGGARAQRP